MTEIAVSAADVGKPCPYCRFPLKSGLAAERCDACGSIHHQECWEEGTGCAVFGCVNSGSAAAVAESPLPAAPALPRRSIGVPAGPDVQSTPRQELRLGVEMNGLPLELWLVVGLVAAAGIYFVQASLRALPDAIRLFSLAFFPRGLAFVLLVIVVILGAFGVALLWLALRLRAGSRVARGLTYLAAGSLFAGVLFGSAVTTGQTLSMLAGLGAAAILAFAPAVQPIFTGPDAPDADHPTGLVVARVALALWLLLLGVDAVLDFCLAGIEGKYVALGLLEAGIVAGGIAVYRRLGLADPRARLIATAGALVAFVLLLSGRREVGFTLLLGVTAAIPICLWIPADVRAFYGESPIGFVRTGE